jgi:hypothetical protein
MVRALPFSSEAIGRIAKVLHRAALGAAGRSSTNSLGLTGERLGLLRPCARVFSIQSHDSSSNLPGICTQSFCTYLLLLCAHVWQPLRCKYDAHHLGLRRLLPDTIGGRVRCGPDCLCVDKSVVREKLHKLKASGGTFALCPCPFVCLEIT